MARAIKRVSPYSTTLLTRILSVYITNGASGAGITRAQKLGIQNHSSKTTIQIVLIKYILV